MRGLPRALVLSSKGCDTFSDASCIEGPDGVWSMLAALIKSPGQIHIPILYMLSREGRLMHAGKQRLL